MGQICSFFKIFFSIFRVTKAFIALGVILTPPKVRRVNGLQVNVLTQAYR